MTITQSERDKIRLTNLLARIDIDELIAYYNEHTKEDTKKKFNLTTKDFEVLRSYYPNLTHDKNTINRIRENTNLIKYGYTNFFTQSDLVENSYIKKYGSVKAKRQKCAETAKKNAFVKYGCLSASQTPEVKEKRVATCLKKYGTTAAIASSQSKEKSKQTKLNKYGDANFHNVEKMKQTNIEKYGVTTNLLSADQKLNGKATMLQTYGVLYPLQNEAIRNKVKETWRNKTLEELEKFKQSQMNTMQKRYGVNWYCLLPEIHKGNKGCKSKPNIKFESYLIKENIKYTTEYIIQNYRFDFKVDDILIEVNPWITHNVCIGIYNNPVDKLYHRNKTLMAQSNGFKCLHIFDWTDVKNIIMILKHPQNYIFKDLKEPQCYLYDIKKQDVINTQQFYDNNDVVLIYDDGFVVEGVE